MGFSRQEYWSGLPFPSPEALPDPGIEPRPPELQSYSLPSEPPGKPCLSIPASNKSQVLLKYPSTNQPRDIACPGEWVSPSARLYPVAVLRVGLSCELSVASTPGSWKNECLSPGGESGLCVTASITERSFKDGRNISMFRCWEEQSS